MDEILALDRPKLSLEILDDLLDLCIRPIPAFLVSPTGSAETEAQPHGSPHDGSANCSPAGYASPERGSHLGRLGFVKIQILSEDRDHGLGSVQPARQEVE